MNTIADDCVLVLFSVLASVLVYLSVSLSLIGGGGGGFVTVGVI